MQPTPAPLTRDAGRTLTEQLALRYADRIRQRLLAPGARLPSVRECARHHGVSPHTVVAAYDQLLAQGLIEARQQRGYFVRTPAAAAAPRPGAVADVSPAERLAAPLNAAALIRGMFHRESARPAPGLGALPPDWLDLPALAAALRRVSLGDRLAPLALQYGEPAGDMRLRAALSVRLAEVGIAAPPAQIVTTVGATHAVDVVSRTLLAPGDAVLVDEPGWAVEFARLERMGMRILPVPRGIDGPDLEAMRALVAAHRPRLYITVSVLHNPTGLSLAAAHAHQVLRLAEQADFHIVEDDTYTWLASAHSPRLSALDGLGRTIYVSGFSKILAPNWRIGFIAASPALVDRFIDTKLLSTLTTPALLEQAIGVTLEQGLLRRHVERVRTRLDAARARSVALAEAAGCAPVTPPRGLFAWVDTGVDTDRLAQSLLDAGWLIAPGSLFHASHRPSTLMRINVATSQDAAFWKALDAARRGLRRR
ncbi:PLP-dependent aminotransferase family protein [Caldimonas sp. KR1-144]|uniref:aminotransferase-like domain-containing protein n=1 Tax=Caldimonas sp. KR1-144 TaxID=3400911 RepID=UPI003C0D6EB0